MLADVREILVLTQEAKGLQHFHSTANDPCRDDIRESEKSDLNQYKQAFGQF